MSAISERTLQKIGKIVQLLGDRGKLLLELVEREIVEMVKDAI